MSKMHFIGFLAALALWPQNVAASESLREPRPVIVALKPGISSSEYLAEGRMRISRDNQWEFALSGFAASLDGAAVNGLRQDPRVESVIDDTPVYAFSSVTQSNAPWGLARLSSRSRLLNQNSSALNFNYTYDPSGGNGVDVYILDTGVRITHNEFEGRASWGQTFGGYADVDANGHGTHCAGIVAGKTFGVAKKAHLVAVRVLSDQGSTATSTIISGINWIIQRARTTARPTVVLIALGGSANTALDSAVITMINSGIHVVVASGSSNTTPANTSPARVPAAITVGSTTIADARASSSNYGPGVDVYAPGTNILSAWHTSDNATNTLSGTSMAAAHVAGLVAYIIGLEGNVTPAEMEAKIKNWAIKDILSGIPSGLNYLAHNSNST